MLSILHFYSDVALGNRLYNSYTPPWDVVLRIGVGLRNV